MFQCCSDSKISPHWLGMLSKIEKPVARNSVWRDSGHRLRGEPNWYNCRQIQRAWPVSGSVCAAHIIITSYIVIHAWIRTYLDSVAGIFSIHEQPLPSFRRYCLPRESTRHRHPPSRHYLLTCIYAVVNIELHLFENRLQPVGSLFVKFTWMKRLSSSNFKMSWSIITSLLSTLK